MKTKATIIALLSTVSAFAGSSTPPIESTAPAEVSSWEVRGALYGWAESFDGDVGIRGLTAGAAAARSATSRSKSAAIAGVSLPM